MPITGVRQETLLSGIEEMLTLHHACIAAIESMLPGMDEGSAGDWRLFLKTLNRHWRCWSQRAAELRQQLFGIPKAPGDEAVVKASQSPCRAQIETLLAQHRQQYSSLDSTAAASRDYRTMCIARTQLAEALAFEQKLDSNPGSRVKLRLAS